MGNNYSHLRPPAVDDRTDRRDLWAREGSLELVKAYKNTESVLNDYFPAYTPIAKLILEYRLVDVRISDLSPRHCTMTIDFAEFKNVSPHRMVKEMKASVGRILEVPVSQIIVQDEKKEYQDDEIWDPLKVEMVDGRPFTIDSHCQTLIAESSQNGVQDWSLGASQLPSVTDLPTSTRTALAEHWTATALAEHASIASFSRHILELMSIGAPSSIIAAAQEAALDEVNHARMCFSLASVYAGKAVEPGSFPLSETVKISTTPEGIATSTCSEGCVAETISCVIALIQSHSTSNLFVKKFLSKITEDETRHAILAWKTVKWIVEKKKRQKNNTISAKSH